MAQDLSHQAFYFETDSESVYMIDSNNHELDYMIDYNNYEMIKKNVINISDVIELDKPKLNRNNKVFGENLDKLTFNYDCFTISESASEDESENNICNIINGENTNYTQQQDSQPISKR